MPVEYGAVELDGTGGNLAVVATVEELRAFVALYEGCEGAVILPVMVANVGEAEEDARAVMLGKDRKLGHSFTM